MADAAEAVGLSVPEMPVAAQQRLKALLPFAAVRNPVDITAQAFNDLSLIGTNLRMMLAEGGYDVIVAFFTVVAGSWAIAAARSEERRVGKEGVRTCRSRWSMCH